MPTSTPSTDLLTVADYRAMPEGPPYYQLVEGELIMPRRPAVFIRTSRSTSPSCSGST